MDISQLVRTQRAYFAAGATKPVDARIRALESLRSALLRSEAALTDAMARDFRKAAPEVYMTEIGLVLDEIRFHLRHLRGWVRPRRVKTPLAQFPSRSFLSPEPYGVVLILAPWNYPIQLCLEPLVGAISAGNCAIVKPSAYAPATSHAIAALIADTFSPEFVACVEGGREENTRLLDERFDYIFFTGSPAVGKLVMQRAAEHLTPVSLELGGKSPVIVDETADVKLAARRIAFGKILNAGQTCVAPDYAFVHERIQDEFFAAYEAALHEFFPDGDLEQMPVIVNDKHFARLQRLLQGETAVIGGGSSARTRFIAPTVLRDVRPDSPIMQEEIFGPILPVMPFRELHECTDYITAHEKPLALYLFTNSRKTEEYVLSRCSFGGGCINDTIVHLSTSYLPFGGVGASGMGSYHGKKSFETFSHTRSILKKANWLDLPIRYHPYTAAKVKLLRLFLR